MQSGIHTLEKLHASLIESLSEMRQRHSFGAFDAFLNPEDAMTFLNYTVAKGRPTKHDLESVIDVFRSAGRKPRFEFFSELSPGLESMLQDSGFELELQAPLMAMDRTDFSPRPRSFARWVESASDSKAYLEAANEAFGADIPVDDGAVDRHMESIRQSKFRCAAVFDHDLAIAGGVTVGNGAIVELAGVATRPAYRRRGFASMASSFLCDDHFFRGGEAVWLSAGDEAARAVYAKLGFQEIGVQLNYSMPS